MSRMKSAATIAAITSALIASGITTATNAAATTTTLGAKVLSAAKNQLGKPYLLGATGTRKFDCSGLIYYSRFKDTNRNHHSWFNTAQAQYNHTSHISSKSRRLGDLIFFGYSPKSIKHVGIYAGNGKMIDANSGDYYKHRVTTEPVKGWFSQHYNVYYGRLA